MIAAIIVLATSLPCSCDAAARVKKIEYRGWKNCYEITNPLVRVVVAPAIGGRIMEYSIQGRNVLWQNEKELGVLRPSDVGKLWHNYGGHKAWNAPQEKWRTPDADNYYDYAPALSAEVLPETPDAMAGVRVKCAPIPHLGIQFQRDILVSASTSQVRIIETMKNISGADIEWAPWGVTQVNAPCWIVFPINANSKFGGGWKVMWPQEGTSTQTEKIGGFGVMKAAGALEKIGIDATDGWMAYFKDQLGYVKQWSVQTGVPYPDGGCTAQFFTADETIGDYAELEVLAPLKKLRPGEEAVLTEDWFLTVLDNETADSVDAVKNLKRLQTQGLLPRSVTF